MYSVLVPFVLVNLKKCLSLGILFEVGGELCPDFVLKFVELFVRELAGTEF